MNSPFTPNAIRAASTPAQNTAHSDDRNPECGNPDPLATLLPEIMRIQSLERLLGDDGKIHNRATLFHHRCALRVHWISQHVDTRLHRYVLVTIRRAQIPRSTEGATLIDRLLPADRPLPSFNLFETVLPEWVNDRDLVARAADLWSQLPRPLAHLLNAVFWDHARFHRFVLGPSSIQSHHTAWNGNLRHSVEVAEYARDIGRKTSLANLALLIAGGLLHDAAKADEYRYDRSHSRFRLSDRGELIGHRDTLIEWIAVARETGRVIIPDAIYLALLHTINAARGAPHWLGLREPRCLEAEILSMADRLSGQDEVHARCAPNEGQAGFGAFHPHLGRRTYVTPRKTL